MAHGYDFVSRPMTSSPTLLAFERSVSLGKLIPLCFFFFFVFGRAGADGLPNSLFFVVLSLLITAVIVVVRK